MTAAQDDASATTGNASLESVRDVPVTERVISRLRAPWWVATIVWALLPFVRPFLATFTTGAAERGTWPQDLTDRLSFQVVFAYLVFLSLWAVREIYQRCLAVLPHFDRLGVTGPIIRGTGSVRGPVALTLLVAGASFTSETLALGAFVAIADLPLMAAALLPVMTFVWIFLAVLVAVNRLGSEPLRLDRFPLDRMLGLGSVGSLAWTAFWLVLLAVLPAIFLTGGDIVTIATAVIVLLIGVGAFFLSTVRLHRRMAGRKDALVAEARSRFVEAYEPIGNGPNTRSLAERANSILAAKALLEVAESTRTWPIDEGVLSKFGVVLFGVLTALAVRIVFTLLGFGG